MNEIAMQAAEREVSAYRNQSAEILQQHTLAMECRDCEDLLLMGIESLRWIERAFQNYQQKIFDGQSNHDPQAEERFLQLYQNWLKPCDDAEKWIHIQLDRGFYPDNLDAFRACCEKVRDILEQRSFVVKGQTARAKCPDEDKW
jgi:hypothetical protein